ncbi:MAG: hypothetical protein VKJ02_06385 [Snowella sp.]|nr:hypothetical protein [Snowella sp.]
MLNLNHAKSGKAALAALLIGTTLFGSFVPVSAKPTRQQLTSGNSVFRSAPSSNYNRNQNQNFSNTNQRTIPSGTLIPLTSNETDTLTISPNESRTLRLNVASNIREANGNILIPAGSEVTGQLRSSETGVQFIAQQLTLNNGQRYSLNATSRELVGFQSENSGSSAGDIIKGTLAGAGTATIISGTTGDRRITPLEVLGGAAVGALAGWALPQAGIIGGGTREVMTIDPSQDLNLTLQAPLYLNATSSQSRWNSRSFSW